MGKRRKAIRWLVTIVIVALIGGVTAVAVDRRIREQVEEEYLDRVMEMVNLNGWYRKALSITGEAKYSWDGIEYPEGMYIDKNQSIRKFWRFGYLQPNIKKWSIRTWINCYRNTKRFVRRGRNRKCWMNLTWLVSMHQVVRRELIPAIYLLCEADGNRCPEN